MRDDRLYLIHICECIDRIEKYTCSGKKEFFENTKTQDAVLRNLQTLGESARHASEELKANHPEVKWRRIVGFRNVLVHEYLGLKLDLVWEVVDQFLPELKSTIQAILKEIGEEP